MSEEDLELLITLDDPEGAQEEDIFNHRPAGYPFEYSVREHPDQRAKERAGNLTCPT